MMKTLLASLCALPLVACVQQGSGKDIDAALPTSDQVSINLPANARAATSRVTAEQPHVLGQTADWYVATRNVTTTFNGGSGLVLTLIHTIVQYPVTTTSGKVSTWGPWSDALSPGEYKLDVTAVGDGTYTYQLSGRPKAQTGADFQVIVDGNADPRAGDLQGNGSFSLDFDVAKAVDPTSATTGHVDVNYDLAKKHIDLTLASTDASGAPLTGDYAYDEAADGGGQMVFDVTGNAGGGPANEMISLRSRWQNTGAGRADARIAGGDLGTLTATASECWDTSFAETFYIDAVSNGTTLAASAGAATSCVFSDADLPDAK
jgi:hypothetical protein